MPLLNRVNPTLLIAALWAILAVVVPVLSTSASAGDSCCSATKTAQISTKATNCCETQSQTQPEQSPNPSDTPSEDAPSEDTPSPKPADDHNCCGNDCSSCLRCGSSSIILTMPILDSDPVPHTPVHHFGHPVAQHHPSPSGGPDAPPPCFQA